MLHLHQMRPHGPWLMPSARQSVEAPVWWAAQYICCGSAMICNTLLYRPAHMHSYGPAYGDASHLFVGQSCQPSLTTGVHSHVAQVCFNASLIWGDSETPSCRHTDRRRCRGTHCSLGNHSLQHQGTTVQPTPATHTLPCQRPVSITLSSDAASGEQIQHGCDIYLARDWRKDRIACARPCSSKSTDW